MKTPKQKEDRLDRLEKNLEMFFQGMRQLREAQEQTAARFAETDALIRELRQSQQQTDAQLAKTIKKLDDIGRQLGDLGLVQGEVAEDLFYRNVSSVFKPRALRFEHVRRNVKIKGFGEYDIVAEDGDKVLVIEVKNKLEKRLVDAFLEKKLPRFKQLLPRYRDRKVLAGIGALVVKDDVGRYAEKAGLYVLTQTDDGGAALMNKKGFRPKEFA